MSVPIFDLCVMFICVTDVYCSCLYGATVSASTCLTPGCVKAAAKILDNIDFSVDPCEDFYDFACGSFIKNAIINDDRSSLSQFNILSDQVQLQLKSLIDQPVMQNDSNLFTMAKKLYQLCMDQEQIESQGLTAVKSLLRNLGGYPALEGADWDETSFDWIKTNYAFWENGLIVNYLFSFGIGPDIRNSTKRNIQVGAPSLGLRREYLVKGLNEKTVKAYYEFIVDIAVVFGAKPDRAKADLYDSLQFHIALAKLTLPAEKKRNLEVLYQPMTIRKVQMAYPYVPWSEYINTLMKPYHQIRNDEVIMVIEKDYFSNLEALLEKTPKRVQANYMMTRALGSLLTYLTNEISKRGMEYVKVTRGIKVEPPRWKSCVDFASSSLQHAVSGAYVNKYINNKVKHSAEEIIENLKTQFIDMLGEVEWMGDQTKKKALEKVHSMRQFIAYPDELLNEKIITDYYKDLEIDCTSYMAAAISLANFDKRKTILEFREPVNKADWKNYPAPYEVNGYYAPLDNSIQLPAGILQSPFFNSERPKYLNYGSLGFAIGHEITHGFDDEGKQFDKDGNLVEWWDPETKRSFEKRAQCIIEQYGNYSVTEIGLKINGINTQGENIADNGGIKEAYRAYQNWVKRNGPEAKLPGLKYTPNQLFWISAASIWCSKIRTEVLKLKIITHKHTVDKFRVNGPVSNSQYFENDWNCPLGSKMNPPKRCIVW